MGMISRVDAMALVARLSSESDSPNAHFVCGQILANIQALPAVQPYAAVMAERDRCVRIVEQLQDLAKENGWQDRDAQTRRIVAAIREEIIRDR